MSSADAMFPSGSSEPRAGVRRAVGRRGARPGSSHRGKGRGSRGFMLAGVGTGAAVFTAGAVAAHRRRSRPAGGTAQLRNGTAAARPRSRPVARTDLDELLRLPQGSSSTVTTSDGAALVVTDLGSGPPVVLCHGWTETSGVWAGVARRLLERGMRVVLYDQRGHGGSRLGSDRITMSRIGADLREVLTALDLRQAVLVGHSMGGMTIMALLSDDPGIVAERAGALVLVSTAAAGLGRSRWLDASAGRIMATSLATRVLAGPAGARIVHVGVGGRPLRTHLAATAAQWAGTEGATRAEAFVAMAAMDLRAGLVAAALPVTVVVGQRDRLTPPRLARDIAARIPGAELVVLPGAGHQLQFERPDELVELIIAAAAAAAGQATAHTATAHTATAHTATAHTPTADTATADTATADTATAHTTAHTATAVQILDD